MSTPQRHIIRRLQLEVDTGQPRPDARERQAQLAALCRERLPALLDRWLGEWGAPDTFVQIERLDLAVDDIDLDRLEQDWAAKVEPCLREAFERALRREDRATKTIRQTAADLVLHFLKTGRLPWWVETPDSDMVREALRKVLAEPLAPALRADWIQVLAEPAARQRLARHAGDWELAALLRRAAVPAFAESVESWLTRLRTAVPDWTRARRQFWPAVWTVFSAAPAAVPDPEWLRRQLREDLPEARPWLGESVSTPESSPPPPKQAPSRAPTPAHLAPPASEAQSPGRPRRSATAKRAHPDRPPDSEDRPGAPGETGAAALPGLSNATDRAGPAPEARTGASSPRDFEETDRLYLYNAGLALLAPYLPYLWERLDWVRENEFVGQEERFAAIQVLQFLCDGQDDPPEYLLDLPKVLCGLSPEALYAPERPLAPEARAEAEALLEAVLDHAPGLGLKSIDGLRGSFLLRKGVLRSGGDHWLLHVENEVYDLVLRQIPWNFQIIKFPWMEAPVLVDWGI